MAGRVGRGGGGDYSRETINQGTAIIIILFEKYGISIQ